MVTLLCALLHAASVFASGSSALGAGAPIRLVIYHDDGFGDLNNAVALARQLTARHPAARYPVIVEDPRAIAALARVHDDATLRGVSVLAGDTADAREVLATSPLQIVCVPAGGAELAMPWGRARFNLYVEEPGVPACEVKYAAELIRGQVHHRADGTSHLRVNPGFGASTYGVASPVAPPPREAVPRVDLLEILGSVGLRVEARMVDHVWGTAYYHSQYAEDGYVYLHALARAQAGGLFRTPAVVFDFGSGRDPRHYLARVRKLGRRFWRPASEFSVVKVGPVPHDMYLEFLRNVDLPIAMTGTQSLLEAIERHIPFVYEFIAWKMDINFGMAEVILAQFAGEERRYLLDWILGEGDRISSREDLARSRQDFVTAPHARGARAMRRHRSAVFELMVKPERRALVRRLLAPLRAQFNLPARLERCVEELTSA